MAETKVTPAEIYIPYKFSVYKNGVAMHKTDDFTVTGTNQITFVTAPATGTKITGTYIVGSSVMISGSNSLITDEVPSGTVNGSTTLFTASRAYIGGTLEVFINGVKQARTTHFTETSPSAGTFTMSDAPLTGDNIIINYQFVASVTGNADTVDGIHASSTLTANQLTPLDSSARFPVASLPLSQNVFTFNSYSSSAVTSTGTSIADITWATLTVTVPVCKLLIHFDAQQDNSGFVFYSLRSTATPAGQAAISSFDMSKGAASATGTHNLAGWNTLVIPTAGTYTFMAGINGDNGARTHNAYAYISMMMIAIGV